VVFLALNIYVMSHHALLRVSFWRSPSHGAQPLGLPSSQQSSHQGVQARPAHPPPPKLARHLRLTNHAALRCQGMGRGGGGATGRTMKTKIIHTSVRRPAQRTPCPQPCTVTQTNQAALRCQGEGRGRGWCCWAHPGKKVWKIENQGLARATQPTSRSGNLAGRPSKIFCRGIQVLVTRGAVSSAVERTDPMFGSWRKLPDGAQSTSPEQCLMAQASSDNFPECGCKVRGRRKTWTESSLLHASTRLGARISTI
jgi:hypothetical protein